MDYSSGKIFLVLFIGFYFGELVACDEVPPNIHNWENFKKHFGKEYSPEEEMMRKTIFLENVVDILVHNQEASDGLHSHTLAVNSFSDLTSAEWAKLMNRLLGLLQSRRSSAAKPFYYEPEKIDSDLPNTVDWRTKNAVTEVRNQGSCGACWTFSAVGAIEGAWAIKTGKLVQLSEQNLLDCTDKDGNDGCEGGNMDSAFEYVIKSGGIDRAQCYPYLAKKQYFCHYKTRCIGANITNFAQISEGDESALKAALALRGPVAAAMNAEAKDIQHYRGGVYNNPRCSTQVTHGVLIVGYGTDEKGLDYWLIKNSWGTKWGTDGYLKLARNRDNKCGITNMASFPIV